jgi:hypothetical protein
MPNPSLQWIASQPLNFNVRPHREIMATSNKDDRGTTVPGYRNKNGQVVVRGTDLPGNDHLQRIYVLRCELCGTVYGANGSDIFQRLCPECGGGRPGLAFGSAV